MIQTVSGPVALLVTDLDNTLYDWVGSFVPAFYAMAEKAAAILDLDIETLLDDLRLVHQRHGSSEHPFALLEAASVRARLSGLSRNERAEVLDAAFHRFNSVRKERLALYDGVTATLEALAERGVPMVAYTDARIPNSLYRVNRLGLDHFIEHLYAPGARFPDRVDTPARETLLKVLPEGDKKPNPRTLLDICRDLGVPPGQTLYIGDSMSRDIFMAASAGVRSAWARYGIEVEPGLWEKLVRITHWTDTDVADEARLKAEAAGARPDATLDRFADLLDRFDFAPQRTAQG
ncbi:HAD family hydrolase [Sphingomonas sp. DC2300-3]|uniref:HAD family hydrolase n=1 Tax=unclassified Sphingomonas TaxID=196159 RepID=UPI003CF491E0